jgi:hypothetical protein
MIFLLPLLIVASASAYAAENSADSNFRKFWKSPTEKNLKIFKKSCTTESQPKFAGGTAGELARQAIKKASLAKIRALVFAEANCSDGAARESLLSLLGNEILLNQTPFFIEAVAVEKSKDAGMMLKLSAKDVEGVECETNQCREQAKEYFAKKTNAIKLAKIKKTLEPVRQELLLSSWGK